MNYLRPDGGKCVYYYFYFIDEVLGLCFLSVPTWCPFRAQFYFNGHNWLASKLRKAHVSFEMRDNALAGISDWQKAQDVSDSLTVTEIHARMDAAVARYVPDLAPLGHYHWSIAQAEYATDIVFRSADDLAPLYDHLLRTAIHVVKFSDIATFLGRPPDQPGNQQIGGDFSIRIHGTPVRHYLGPASIKMYDKHGLILRVETTTNDVTFFRHHRMVEQRDGKRVMKLAYLKKSIYSLCPDLLSLSRAANDRYISSSPPLMIQLQESERFRRSPTRSKSASTAIAASTSSTMRIRPSSKSSAEGSTSSKDSGIARSANTLAGSAPHKSRVFSNVYAFTASSRRSARPISTT
jgi:hypothetical protein